MEEELQVLENFLMEIDMLDKIESRLSEFNVFETLNIFHNELRHSNVLSWLIKPNENHGLSETFLRKWLQQIFLNNREYMREKGFSMLELATLDLMDVEVLREWRNIDLTVVSEEHKFVLIIENKVHSKESSHQLIKYFDIVTTEYPNYRKVFIFLTPDGISPSDEENWLTVKYSQVLDTLIKVKNVRKDFINDSVNQFLNQYIEILRRYFMGENELEKICREIYFKHQKALDLIFEYKPDLFYEISLFAEELVSSSENFILDSSNKTLVRFIPKSFDELIPKEGQGWTKSNRILIWEIQNRNDKLTLKLIIGPGNQEIRAKLFDISGNHKNLFKSRLSTLTNSYTQIFVTEILPKNFLKNQDDLEIIKDRIKQKWQQLLMGELKDIEEIIINEFNL